MQPVGSSHFPTCFASTDDASLGVALIGKDITKAQVGKLCAGTGAFVISGMLGELEFELEENEVTLNLNKNVTAEGEWGKSNPRKFDPIGLH
jgi:hypothetical protein